MLTMSSLQNTLTDEPCTIFKAIIKLAKSSIHIALRYTHMPMRHFAHTV